jgi:hypothetical protein
MEPKCCENAIRVTEEQVAKKMVTALKPLLAGLDPATRKAFVKELVKLGPQFAELVELL